MRPVMVAILQWDNPRHGYQALDQQAPWPARLFVLIALPITLLMARIIPLGRMPDETAHVFRADSITHLQLIGRRDPVGSPIPRAYLLSDPIF